MGQNGFWYSYRTRPFVWTWQLEVLWETRPVMIWMMATITIWTIQPAQQWQANIHTQRNYRHFPSMGRERKIKRRHGWFSDLTVSQFYLLCYELVTLNFNDPLESLWQVIWLLGRQRKVVLIWDNFKRLFALKFVHIWLLNLGWHERMSGPAKTGLFESELTENKCEIDLHCQIEIGRGSGPGLTPD